MHLWNNAKIACVARFRRLIWRDSCVRPKTCLSRLRNGESSSTTSGTGVVLNILQIECLIYDAAEDDSSLFKRRSRIIIRPEQRISPSHSSIRRSWMHNSRSIVTEVRPALHISFRGKRRQKHTQKIYFTSSEYKISAGWHLSMNIFILDLNA